MPDWACTWFFGRSACERRYLVTCICIYPLKEHMYVTTSIEQHIHAFLAKYRCIRFHASHPQLVPDPVELLSHQEITWCRSWHRAITTGQQASSGPGPLLPSMFWPYAIRRWRVRCCPTLCLGVVWFNINVVLLVNEHVCWMCMLTDMSMVWFGLMDIFMSKYVESNI